VQITRSSGQELVVAGNGLLMMPEHGETVGAIVERVQMPRRDREDLIEALERLAVLPFGRQHDAATKMLRRAIVTGSNRKRHWPIPLAASLPKGFGGR
jgi:hypothetical protein